ncbi:MULTISPECIES: hypothetical protein [Cryobacterium]|uniref:DUF222 domain-containing protein n=1 Tax=Cryobacterium breve TaxID=1259258 RepID=A0ABY2JB89_9MICO|nr:MULTISPECIES: hypothetical protein [Cryobacterium]TFC92772.1 hypothetical protein E3T20_11525 [Cryobacterium sp. TmT3-12]TFD01608.1 hypothetical protein E3O65_01320 [Cryobacterium breve]
MKTSNSDQQQTLGRHFDAIRETQADTAWVAAGLAEQIDAARLCADAGAALAAREAPVAAVPLARWDAARIADREFVTELACTLRLPVRSTETLIAESQTLMHELPATRAALQKGSITYRHAQAVMHQAWSLPAEALPGFELAPLKSAPTLPWRT